MTVQAGDKAPDFTLKNTDLEEVSLESLAGKIDKEGIVRYASVSDDAKVLPDFAAVKACLESLN
jgi:peroxiredoxin